MWDERKGNLDHNETTFALNRFCEQPQQSFSWAQRGKHGCLLVRPFYRTMLVEGRQTLRPVAVFGFWVSGQVVCPLLIMIVTWCTINTLTPLLPYPPFYIFFSSVTYYSVFLMSFYTFYCKCLLVKPSKKPILVGKNLRIELFSL